MIRATASLPALLLGALVIGTPTLGTPALSAQAPRENVLELSAFLEQVRAYHPVVRQATLLATEGRAEERIARGGFDPTLSSDWARKRFGSTEYYDYATAKLSIPTPVGANVVFGFERAVGRYATEELRTSNAGQLTAGLQIPIGQRMITDERRTALIVARGLRTAAEGARDAERNKVILSATKQYALWYEASRRFQIANEGLGLAEFRRTALVARFRAGESAAIDTLEASLEVERRRVQRLDAQQGERLARLEIEAALWDADGAPVVLPEAAVPALAPLSAVESDSAGVIRWVELARRSHPEVRKAEGKSVQLTAQRQFAAQQLLPAASLDATALADRADREWALSTGPEGNLKLGGSLKLPLLLLKERGKLTQARAKEDVQRLEVALLRREVAIGVRAVATMLRALDEMLVVQRLALTQAGLLRDGEQRRFEAGESTLFLVNIRERTVLDEAAKLAALEAKRMSVEVELQAAIGVVE